GYPLNTDLKKLPGFHPDMYTVWHFVGFSLDPKNEDLTKAFFVVATIPEKIATMTDGLEEKDVDPRLPELLKSPPKGKTNAGLVLAATRHESGRRGSRDSHRKAQSGNEVRHGVGDVEQVHGTAQADHVRDQVYRASVHFGRHDADPVQCVQHHGSRAQGGDGGS